MFFRVDTQIILHHRQRFFIIYTRSVKNKKNFPVNFKLLLVYIIFILYFQRPRPSPIALEPCVSNRAAVLSLIVRMPTGGKSYAPNGYTGIAIASSLVTLGMIFFFKFSRQLFY